MHLLDRRATGLSIGVLNGVMMALLAWIVGAFHLDDEIVKMAAKFYPGYSTSFGGGLIGAVYGFLTGFGFGWLAASLYNRLKRAAGHVPGSAAPTT